MSACVRCVAAWLTLLAVAACTPPAHTVAPVARPTAAPTALPTPSIMQPLRETFDSAAASHLRSGSVANAHFMITDGRYTITVTETSTLVWSTVGAMFADGSAETDIIFDQGTPATTAGLLFHMQDSQNFYMASLSSDGFYALDARENSNWRSIVEWTRWPTIDTRGNPNRLRLVTKATSISLYLNDTLLVQTVDQTFATGSLALGVNTFETANVSVQFDNLSVQPDPSGAVP